MTTRAELRRRPEHPALSATRIAAELVSISDAGIELSFDERAGLIRVRIALDRDDAFGFPIEVNDDRAIARVVGAADAIVNWSFLELGRRLECDVLIDDEPAAANGDSEEDQLARRVVLGSALSDVQDFERRVLAGRVAAPAPPPPAERAPVRSLIEGLAEKGEIVLVEGKDQSLAILEELVDKPLELYEAILENPGVDEIFLDEAEFKKRWRKACG